MTAQIQRSTLCPWQKAKNRKKTLTEFAQPMTAALRLPGAHSFLLRYSRGYSWHERTWDLVWKWREEPNRLLLLICFHPALRNQQRSNSLSGKSQASRKVRKIHARRCVPDCFPVISDGCCLVALVSQVFANVVVNLKTQVTIWLISTWTVLCSELDTQRIF